MKNIRNKVFETNSSSTHSISISTDSSGILDTIIPSDSGTIELTGGYFGWEWEKYNDALTKANYIAVYLGVHGDYINSCNPGMDYMKSFKDVVCELTGAKEVVLNIGDSYIDHQSDYGESRDLLDIFDTKNSLKNWIFNKESWLFTGNDNSDAPPNFYDAPETKYVAELRVEGNSNAIKLKEGYTDNDIKTNLYHLLKVHVDNIKYDKDEEGYRLGFDGFSKFLEDQLGPDIVSHYKLQCKYPVFYIEHTFDVAIYDGAWDHGVPYYNINSFKNFDKNELIVFIVKYGHVEDISKKYRYIFDVVKELHLKFEIIPI